jgi:hypothetical protein
MLVLQVVAALLHAVPRLVYPNRPSTTTVVVYISNLGPAWVILFGVTAPALGFTIVKRRWMNWAHLAAGAVWTLYASALVYGAWATKGTWFFPILAVAVVFVHTKLASGYDDDAGKEARR